MLAVKLICVGKMREKFYIDAFSEYSKRLGAYCRFECVELAETRLPDAPSPKEIGNALDKEAAEIMKNIPQDAYLAAMCVEGIQMASEELAELVTRQALSGRSYGISPSVKKRADIRLSMSKMTFPHHLARVMLAEQIYRAFKINEGSRYHK